MKRRLIQALIAGSVGALVGVYIALRQESDQMLGIVLITTLIGMFFGIVFKFRAL